MPQYRLLFFRNSCLEWWDSIEASGDIAAIEEASGYGEEQTVEVWSDDRRLATIRPSLKAASAVAYDHLLDLDHPRSRG